MYIRCGDCKWYAKKDGYCAAPVPSWVSAPMPDLPPWRYTKCWMAELTVNVDIKAENHVQGARQKQRAALLEALRGGVELLEFLPAEYIHRDSGLPICYSPDGALAAARAAIGLCEEGET